jgi:BirA family biotin operon repressor/biotin-[acetyl-CoA-carboxylase] ligase
MGGTRFADIRWLDSVDSTNRYVMDEARSGTPEGLVVVADHQSSGRGRLGRIWEAPAGSNLLTSVLLRPKLPPDQRYLACVVVALAAADAMAAVAGVTPQVKWPNDLLAPDGRKLAGVLAESEAGPAWTTSDPVPIVVGIGINVGWPASDRDLPDHLVGTATSLRQVAGRPVDRSALLHAWLDRLDPRVTALGTEEGRRTQLEELQRRCVTIGNPVRVELAHRSFEGTATGLTAEGHLVVTTAQGVREVAAGDVVHLRPVVERGHRAPQPLPGPPPGGDE